MSLPQIYVDFMLSRNARALAMLDNLNAFLANHREVIVAFDFFTVPTLTFKLLYRFLS
jgi:hypothetical protein